MIIYIMQLRRREIHLKKPALARSLALDRRAAGLLVLRCQAQDFIPWSAADRQARLLRKISARPRGG